MCWSFISAYLHVRTFCRTERLDYTGLVDFLALFQFSTLEKIMALFGSFSSPPPPPPPTSLKHEVYGLTAGFTRLIMKTNNVCHGLISLHVNFHKHQTKWTVTSNIKICTWGGKGKRALFSSSPLSNSVFKSLLNVVITQWNLAWWTNRQL